VSGLQDLETARSKLLGADISDEDVVGESEYRALVADIMTAIADIHDREAEESSAESAPVTLPGAAQGQGTVQARTPATVAAGTYVTFPNPMAKNPMGPQGAFPITSRYGNPRGHRRHYGVDVGVAPGTALYASLAGSVTAGNMGGYGCYIDIDQGDGWVARYAHLLGPGQLDDYPEGGTLVATGDTVTRGQLIGRSGGTKSTREKPNPCAGNSRGPHLHFELRYQGATVTPEDVLVALGEITPAEWNRMWGS